jgi:DNA-binding Lrp family transcriptional regulator
MTRAVVLINAEIGREKEVLVYLRTLTKLEKLPRVKEAYTVYGIYDNVALVEAKDNDNLKKFVKTKLRDYRDGRGGNPIRSTLTMIIASQNK